VAEGEFEQAEAAVRSQPIGSVAVDETAEGNTRSRPRR
jgi:hypothetical protein